MCESRWATVTPGSMFQVVAKQAPYGRAEVERPVVDERHDDQRSETLASAGDPEASLYRVVDPVGAIGETARALIEQLAASRDLDDT
jgi:hypothetical protein